MRRERAEQMAIHSRAKMLTVNYDVRSPKNDPTQGRNATFSRTDSFILKRVGKRFLSFQNHDNRLDELFRTVHKAKKTLSNSLQDKRIGSRKSHVSPRVVSFFGERTSYKESLSSEASRGFTGSGTIIVNK